MRCLLRCLSESSESYHCSSFIENSLKNPSIMLLPYLILFGRKSKVNCLLPLYLHIVICRELSVFFFFFFLLNMNSGDHVHFKLKESAEAGST